MQYHLHFVSVTVYIILIKQSSISGNELFSLPIV